MAATVTDKSELTHQQRQAILALLSAPTVTEAANRIGVRRETLSRWMRKPAFSEALREAERESLQAFSRSLLSLSELAIKALFDALQPSGVPLRYRLQAVGLLAGNLGNVLDLASFEERLSALEAAQNDKQANR